MEKRSRISQALRAEVWSRGSSRCRICGKKLKRAAKTGEYGRWHAGHIVAHTKGGSADVSNLLPTCEDCNLILKNSGSKRIKKILRLGVWTENEIRTKTSLGKLLIALYRKRQSAKTRRKK